MKWTKFHTMIAVWLAVLAVPLIWMNTSSLPAQEDAPDNKYIGAEGCKKCHDKDPKGNQHAKWLESKHAKAFERLASEEAKELGRPKGVDDPQKSDQCLKCHTTGHGLPAESFKKSFDVTQGVQCESCHGPGQNHFKARLMAADEGGEGPAEVPAGEIVAHPPLETCLGCHNEESPGYKPFCFKKRVAEIAHPDPRKTHEAAACACPPDACACKQGECGH